MVIPIGTVPSEQCTHGRMSAVGPSYSRDGLLQPQRLDILYRLGNRTMEQYTQGITQRGFTTYGASSPSQGLAGPRYDNTSVGASD